MNPARGTAEPGPEKTQGETKTLGTLPLATERLKAEGTQLNLSSCGDVQHNLDDHKEFARQAKDKTRANVSRIWARTVRPNSPEESERPPDMDISGVDEADHPQPLTILRY